jgi:dihydroflavonol-4-reductase
MIFVTGSTGLLGFFLIKKLTENGNYVLALIRSENDKQQFKFFKNIDFIVADLFDIYQIDKAIEKCDTVFHCAASVSFDRRKKYQLFKTNIEGTENIVELCKKHKVYLCHVSSVAALGRKINDKVIDENAKWTESKLNSLYAESKYESEIIVWRGIEEGLKASIVNPSVILGPTNWYKSTGKIFKYIFDKKPFYTSGDINWVDVRDVVDMMILLSEKKMTDNRFIINAGSISYKEFFAKIAVNFNKPQPKIKVTPFLAYLAWIFENLKSIITQKEPLVTKDTIKASNSKFYYKNDKIINEFSFQFRDIDETISWTCTEILQLNLVVEK